MYISINIHTHLRTRVKQWLRNSSSIKRIHIHIYTNKKVYSCAYAHKHIAERISKKRMYLHLHRYAHADMFTLTLRRIEVSNHDLFTHTHVHVLVHISMDSGRKSEGPPSPGKVWGATLRKKFWGRPRPRGSLRGLRGLCNFHWRGGERLNLPLGWVWNLWFGVYGLRFGFKVLGLGVGVGF